MRIFLPETIKLKIKKSNLSTNLCLISAQSQLYFKLPLHVDYKREKNWLTLNSTLPYLRTFTALIQNGIIGLRKPYKCRLELVGVGYKAELSGNDLTLFLGLSHTICLSIPHSITLTVTKGKFLFITGTDYQQLKQFCAILRKLKFPDTYKGKGFRYVGEKLSLKEGKKKK